eukprot:CCRYP_009481-RA/>CCRYP_009481-RA protein AED:0.37 eAED:0.37 QI:0/-1/0/1/-1/0/1/0/229
MGTSCAVTFANLYFGKHEKDSILPIFHENLNRIKFYARFVDDVFLIWDGPCDDTWNSLIQVFNNFGILKWETTTPAATVNFLDLTVTLQSNRITTKTYQKVNNPYLYIPPHSAHPPGMIHGIIYSLLRTYYYQNSKHSDFTHFSKLLFQRHILQGWDPHTLRNAFTKALEKLNSNINHPPQPTTCPTTEEETLYFHMQFHPCDIPTSASEKPTRRPVRKLSRQKSESAA